MTSTKFSYSEGQAQREKKTQKAAFFFGVLCFQKITFTFLDYNLFMNE